MARNDDTLLANLGARIATLREKKGLSLRQAAAECNLDPSTMSKIENGNVNVTVTTLAKLAKGLNVRLKDLVDFEI